MRIMAKMACRGADINRKVESGEAALHVADKKNDVPLIEKLLSLGADVNARDKNNSTPLHNAACHDKNVSEPETVEILLKNGADVNALTDRGSTPLYYSLSNAADIKTIETLLKFIADVNIKTNKGKPPIFEAISTCRNVEVIRLLVDHGSELDYVNPDNGRTLLLEACRLCINFCTIELLLKNGLNVNALDHKGQTPLYYFIKSEQPSRYEQIKLLLNFKAEVNVRDNKDRTPLSLALQNCDEESVQLIVKSGADLNYIVNSKRGYTPLMMACFLEWEFCTIESMLKNGADVNAKDNIGETPIFKLLYRIEVGKGKLSLFHKTDIILKSRFVTARGS